MSGDGVKVVVCSRCWAEGRMARIPDDCTTRPRGGGTEWACPEGHVVFVVSDRGELDIGIIRAEGSL